MVRETAAHILLVFFKSQDIYFLYALNENQPFCFDSFTNDYSHKHCWARVFHGDDQEQNSCSHTFNEPVLHTPNNLQQNMTSRKTKATRPTVAKSNFLGIQRTC